jgi:flagellar biogenesis protein FliO
MTVEPGLLALLGLLVVGGSATHWWLGRRGPAAEGPIRVVASRALGAKRALALVEVDGVRLLLGCTDERIACLARLERPAGAAALRAVGARGDGS